MPDHFVLLGQRRRPYLDPEEITATFHALSRTQHPDQQESAHNEPAGAGAFVALNQAQQTLRDPKQRLAYLIGLEHPEVRLAGPSAVPAALAAWFAPIHELLERADKLLTRKAATPSALGRALLARDELALREEVESRLAALGGLHAAALAELREYDQTWQSGDASGAAMLVAFYQRFAYLSRWLEQLRERLFQLGQ